jgi:hypothetical protein
MHLVMDIEPLKKIRSVTRERVCWFARPGIISGAFSFLLFAWFNVDTAGAQSTPPAQADLAQSPEERADVLQKQLEIYAEAEDNLQKQIKEGKAENADLDHLRYERLGVEIDLEVLRRGMAE